jgi:hypothetical protein
LAGAVVMFDVPGGRLSFGDGELDLWAEHLVWCYRLLGVPEGATVAVCDFGTSPLSFLGSRLLMPALEAGVAERLGGRIICLDASEERVVISPAVLGRFRPDVLVVRGDVLGLLLEVSRREGLDLAAADGIAGIVAVGDDRPVPRPGGPWRYLLLVESSLLLAPECATCGAFHLRAGVYRWRDGTVENLHLPGAAPRTLRRPTLVAGDCEQGPGDVRIRLPLGGVR